MKTFKLSLLVLAGLALLATPSGAQQRGPEAVPPAPRPEAAAGPLDDESSSAAQRQEGAESATTLTARPLEHQVLTGAEDFTLRTMGAHRDYLIFDLALVQLFETNPHVALQSTSNIHPLNQFRGGMAFSRAWNRHVTTLGYNGGAHFYTREPDRQFQFHTLGFSHRVRFPRSELMLANQFSYLPETTFGASRYGLGGIGSSFAGGVASGILRDNEHAANSIFLGIARRVNNTVLGEFTHRTSRRSSFTLAGSYGLQHFLDPAFVDSKNFSFGAGYNYAVGRRHTLAVRYGMTEFQFAEGRALQYHNTSVAYGYQITGRMRLQLSGGPAYSFDRNTPEGLASTSRLGWTARSGLAYRFQRSTLRVYYADSPSSGSGVFLGARTQQVGLSASRRLTRDWSGTLGTSYARNKRLSNLDQDRKFDTWRGTVSVGRDLGQYTRLNLHYTFTHQRSNLPFCIGSDCGRVGIRHIMGVGLYFNTRQALARE
jgi:hypothetical protein